MTLPLGTRKDEVVLESNSLITDGFVIKLNRTKQTFMR